MELSGSRVKVRPMTPADAAAYLALAGDPAVAEPAGMQPLASLTQAALHIKNAGATEYGLEVGGQLVGQIGVYPRTGDPAAPEATTREIGYALLPTQWGQGLMTEALGLVIPALFAQGITALWAGSFPDNQRSIALLARLGFQYRFTAALPAGLDGDHRFEAYFELVNENG